MRLFWVRLSFLLSVLLASYHCTINWRHFFVACRCLDIDTARLTASRQHLSVACSFLTHLLSAHRFDLFQCHHLSICRLHMPLLLSSAASIVCSYCSHSQAVFVIALINLTFCSFSNCFSSQMPFSKVFKMKNSIIIELKTNNNIVKHWCFLFFWVLELIFFFSINCCHFFGFICCCYLFFMFYFLQWVFCIN